VDLQYQVFGPSKVFYFTADERNNQMKVVLAPFLIRIVRAPLLMKWM